MATSTLGSGTLVLAGTTSGTTTVTATAVAGTTTLTLPAATDTLVGKATTDTLTNKTLTGAAMNGTVGATTPSTGAFTTLSSTGASSFATSSGNVGIGTSSPSHKLVVSGSGSDERVYFSNTNTAGTQYLVVSSATGRSITTFVPGSSTAFGGQYANPVIESETVLGVSGSTDIRFWTSNTERARFNSTGALVFAGGTTTANGIGITFPATQSASTDANTLDDYEEGTWTPAWVAATGTLGAITYENRQGTYTKVGRMVTAQGGFYNTAFAAGTGSGDLRISGLPFTNGSATVGTGSIGDVRLWLVNNPCAMAVGVSASFITLYYKTTANGAINNLQVSDASNGAATNLVYFTITYQV